METMTRAESKHMYSWWWDSHISPKNSRWLKENLTDMDDKVRLMIKLIEVDEDSFARRAEMYYKKRPELMKLVEEFYRAFRALAERYDHATGVIKQAHKTMVEAFPNQVPFIVPDDGSFSSPGDCSPFTPEMSVSVRAFCDPVNFHGETNGPFTSGEEMSFSKVKKGLNFHDADVISPQNAQVLSEPERLGKSETDIQELKEALARLESEKQAGMIEYEERLRRLSNLESEVSRAQEDSRGLHERASKAEAEVLSLKELLAKLEGEREACLHQYQQCLVRISNLESDVSRVREGAERHNKQASLAEKESQLLREELVQLKADKEAGLAKYMEALEKIANLENRLLLAEGKASVTFERADNAEKEVAPLREALDRATKGKEEEAVRQQQCLEKIASLESEIAISHEEAARLKDEIDQGEAKLKGKEEQYHLLERSNNSMQCELDSLSNKLGVQNQELSDKQKELGRLWTSVQEEHLRFVEVEAAFKALQGLHSQTQDELRSVAAELQERVQLLKDMDIHNQSLQVELQKIRDENNTLSEHNLSSAVLENNMEEEIVNLKEGKNKLETEMELRSDERNALQHEIHCLKEDLNVLHKKHQAILDQVELLGFQPECFGLSVTSLQHENSKLKESCQRGEAEISALLEKLSVMEELDQMADMEKKICLLEEEGHCTRGQLEEEQDQAVCYQFEIFILRNILQDLKETNSSFLNKCDKLLETSKLSEELILELEYENIEQHQEVNFLSEQIKRLRMGMFQLLKVVDVDMEIVCEDNLDKDQMILHRILHKVDDTRSSLSKAWDENQKLLIEKSILETLLGQLKQEVSDLKAVINTLQQEFRIGNDQLSSLQKGMDKLLRSHEQLILTLEEGNHKEELFVAEVVNLKSKLLEMQSVCQELEKENCGILEEKRFLVKTVTHLDDEKIKLEHDNACLVVDAVTLDTLSSIFKNNILERIEVIKQLAHGTCKLCDDNSVLEDNVQIMERMVDKYQVQNMNMKDLLEKFNDELKEVKTANSQLRLETARWKDQLSQKELEFSEALAVKDDQEKHILELSEQYDQLLEESESLRESMQNANAEVCRVLKKQNETDRTVEILRSELKKAKIEAELCETVAGSFFSELQTSSVREALLREKFSELAREYKCLEDENHSKASEVVQLDAKVGSLEGENSLIIAQLAGHIQALATLRDSVASLESHATHTEFENDNDKDNSSSSYEVVADPTSDGISELLNISTRIKAVESKMIETKRLAQERSLKLLKSQSSRSRRGSSGRSSKMIENTKQQKPASYPYEAGELLMKDIILDQASEASSQRKNTRSKYNNSTSDDKILELWETMDQAGSIELTVGRSHYHNKSGPGSSESLEKELEVDRVEISADKDTKRKILDRLASDVQKLTNVQITVQDLKQKVVITENSTPTTKGKETEYERVKEQLDEADRVTTKLLEVNGKLIKKVETSSSIDECFETGHSGRTRRVSEQARRCSEKIGRLQVEVQKLQFILVKLDGGNKTGTRVVERNTRVLLKDYLYASSRTPRRRKKGHFCGCMQTSTSGD